MRWTQWNARTARSRQRMALRLVCRQWRRIASPVLRIVGQYRFITGNNLSAMSFDAALPIVQLQSFNFCA